MPRMKRAITRLSRSMLQVEPHETRIVALSFVFILILMAAYYLLRPVRDAMASDWSDAELSFLWTLNFFLSAGGVLFYGGAISRLRLRRLVPTIYAFFALSFLATKPVTCWVKWDFCAPCRVPPRSLPRKPQSFYR